MKLASLLSVFLAGAFTVEALRIPTVLERSSNPDYENQRHAPLNELFKRKGGGGGGKGGSSGSSSSGSSSSGSTGSSSGSSGSSSGRTGNAGGSTSTGSGAPRSFGGGKYYGGGATTPYAAGGRTPRGLLPIGLIGVGGLAFFGGLWLYAAYMYPYSNPYRFYNATARQNQTKPVKCLCQQYSACGCDDNDDQSYLDNVIGNGTNLNPQLVRAANVNGTDQIFINGTLENGTTAPGGSSSLGSHTKTMESAGLCVLGSVIALAMWTL